MILEQIVEDFRQHENKVLAAKMEAYMKHRFPFYGIKSVPRKALQKFFYPFLKSFTIEETIQLVVDLYAQPQREFHYFAMEILDRKKKELTTKHLDVAEHLILNNTWWDTVDYLSTHIFKTILELMPVKERIDYVSTLISHENMWMNRVAIIYQLPLKIETNTEILEMAILPHVQSKEFFHQKAIGWALRQYSKFNPDYVETFLNNHKLAKLSIREASKYL